MNPDCIETVEKISPPSRALTGSLKDYRLPSGPDLLGRIDGFYEWQDLRRRHNLWPYGKSTTSAPKAHCAALTDSGVAISGVNFASQDYLSLASHPAIKEAAIAAIRDFGVHSAGSAALLGNTRYSLELERQLRDFMSGRETVLYPTGWSAGFAAIQGFVRPPDHVAMDVLAHSCLQEGARASTPNIQLFGHLNSRGLERRLERIRAKDKDNGILVVTESLFSMHSHTPDIGELRDLCDQYKATLLVDCAHDFGSIGEDGLGHLGLQNVMDKADVVIGSFSKTFASNGGFISVKTRAAAEYLKYYSATQTFSNALSPAQAATVLAALGIVRSSEGAMLRRKLMDNILYLRRSMAENGLKPLGDPSPIVPIHLGDEGMARMASARLAELGAVANLVEYPAVPQGNARFRVQVGANHSFADVDQLTALMTQAVSEASHARGLTLTETFAAAEAVERAPAEEVDA